MLLQNIVFFGELPFVPAFTGRDSQVESVSSQCSSSRDHEYSIPLTHCHDSGVSCTESHGQTREQGQQGPCVPRHQVPGSYQDKLQDLNPLPEVLGQGDA